MFEYKLVKVEGGAGLSAIDPVNAFTAKNPDWKLWNVIPGSVGQILFFVFERPLKGGSDSSPPAGGLKDGAKLTDSVVVAFPKRAAA